jgi:polar amino acid transport system substrate-binding protein
MRRSAAIFAVLALCGGCSNPGSPALDEQTVRLPPLLPAGAAFADPASIADTSADDNCPIPPTLKPYAGKHDPIPGGRLARIKERGWLIVGLDQGTFPFSYRDTATGELKGFDVAVAKEVAKDILGDPNRIDYRIISSAQRTSALERGTVDIIVKTMSITCERAKEVTFSAPYFQTQQRVLATSNNDASSLADRKVFPEAKVCAARGSTSMSRFHHMFPTATLLATTTWADCLVAIQQGSVDAVTSDESILFGLQNQDQNLYFVYGLDLGPEVYGIGLPKGEEELLRVVNGVIARIRTDGTWADLCHENLANAPCAQPPAEPRYVDEAPPA